MRRASVSSLLRLGTTSSQGGHTHIRGHSGAQLQPTSRGVVAQLPPVPVLIGDDVDQSSVSSRCAAAATLNRISWAIDIGNAIAGAPGWASDIATQSRHLDAIVARVPAMVRLCVAASH